MFSYFYQQQLSVTTMDHESPNPMDVDQISDELEDN